VADGGQHVGQLAIFGSGVVDVVGDHHRQAELLGEGRRFRDEPVVVGKEMVRQLHEEARGGRAIATAEQRCIPLRHRPGARPVASPQPARQFTLTATRQGRQAFGVRGEQCLAEAWDALGPDQVGPRDEPAQAPPANLRPSQEDQVRTTCPVPDPAQVLLDRIAMTGE
jgi:hypothetical protein